VFKGTRTPAAIVFENLEDGMTIDEAMEQWPVTREQVKAVLEFADPARAKLLLAEADRASQQAKAIRDRRLNPG
jgi:uncharacterized protein (DUF433 family)